MAVPLFRIVFIFMCDYPQHSLHLYASHWNRLEFAVIRNINFNKYDIRRHWIPPFAGNIVLFMKGMKIHLALENVNMRLQFMLHGRRCVCVCVCRGSKWFQQLDKLLWNGKWKTEPKHRLYLHYRTGGWQFDNDNDATFSIELTYYYHSHFVSSIMSLFKFHEMLAIFDTLLFFSCSSCCRLNVRRMNLLGSTTLYSTLLFLYSTQLNSSLSLNLDASHK